MLEDKPLKYRELRRALSRFGVREIKHRGKGSHRLFVHPNIKGLKISYPVKCHSEGQEIASYVVRRIRQTFDISLEDFYK